MLYKEGKSEEEQSKVIKDNKNFIFKVLGPYIEARVESLDGFESYGEMMIF